MNKLLSSEIWPTLKKLCRSKRQKRAAIAYVSSDGNVGFGEGDLLVTDASDSAIRSGQTSAKVLQKALQRGAALFSLRGLHAKVMVIGSTAVIGSANASNASAEHLIEAAWLTDQPTAVAMASALIEDLADLADEIDEAFIRRISEIEIIRGGSPILNRRSPKKLRNRRLPSAWIVGIRELCREFPDEQAFIDKGEAVARATAERKTSSVDWIRFVGRSRFRREVRRGDILIQVWRACGASSPQFVYRQVPVLHCQEEPNCTRVYIESPSNAERTAIRWGQFRKLMNRAGIVQRIGANSIRQISMEQADILDRLWKDV